MDLSSLVAAVDVSDVATAVVAVAAVLMAHAVIAWGARKILSLLRPEPVREQDSWW